MIRLNVDAIVIAPADKNIVSDEINMAIKKRVYCRYDSSESI